MKDEMVEVKLLTGMVGTGFAWHTGDVRKVPADDAARMVKAGLAELTRDRIPAFVEKR